MENKEITIGDLAVMMKDGFEKADKKADANLSEANKRTDEEIRKLAVMMKDGFEKVDKKMDANLLKSNRKTDEEIEKLAVMVKNGFDGMDEKNKEIKEKLTVLERGQEDIKLRQDNSAYRFELQEQEKTLEKHDTRIGVLEKKVLVAG